MAAIAVGEHAVVKRRPGPATAAVAIRDRVRELRRVPARELAPSPRNWRRHPGAQAAALRGLLAQVGFADALLAREREDGVLELIDGHLRAETVPDMAVPVLVLDVDDQEAATLLATLDPLAGLAEADGAALARLLAGVQTDNAAVQTLLEGLAAEYGIDGRGAVGEDPGAQIDRAEELRQKWGTERGQLWEIGSQTVPGKVHRLLCGDSRDVEVVRRLLCGGRADLVVTSPPYGVGKAYEVRGIGAWYETVRPVIALITQHALAACWNIGNLSPTGSQFEEPTWAYSVQMFLERGWRSAWTRVWKKPGQNFGVGPWHLVSAKPVQEYEFVGGFLVDGEAVGLDSEVEFVNCFAGHLRYVRRLSPEERRDWGYRGVWEMTPVRGNDVHCAMFPLELPRRCITLMCDRGASVWDPFCGSGTTLVAAEQCGRVGYGMELEPKYVAVALERLQGLGLAPQLAPQLLPPPAAAG